jgi:hypothetical protein
MTHTPEKITRIRAFLRGTLGKIMTVKFTKRSTGEERTMVCRTGVRAHLKDPEAPTSAKIIIQDHDNDLLRVYDMHKRAYRMIALESVREISSGGEIFTAQRPRRIRSWFLGGAA